MTLRSKSRFGGRDGNVMLEFAIASLILLGGWGLIGHLAMNSTGFGNMGLVWRWLLFAAPVLLAIAAVFLYCLYVARRKEKRTKK